MSSQYETQLAFIFDRPVTKPEWYWSDDDNILSVFSTDSLSGFVFIEQLLDNIAEDLQPFSDDQVAMGLGYIFSSGCSDLAFDFQQAMVPIDRKIKALRSLINLFRDIYAVRCLPYLSTGQPEHVSQLNTNCYMFWDVTPLANWSVPGNTESLLKGSMDLFDRIDWAEQGLSEEAVARMKAMIPQQIKASKANAPNPKEANAYYRAIAGVMQQCLELDHPACVESALHGLGHMVFSKPKIARPIIDNFLKKHRHADPELLEYARAARTGIIL